MSYSVRQGRLQDARHLWELCFEDSTPFVDLYFSQVYQDQETLLLYDSEQEEALAHVGILRYSFAYEGNTYPIGYISGACTHPSHRGRGLMKLLLQEAHRAIRERGDLASILIPATPTLFDFYASLGYQIAFYRSISRDTQLPKAGEYCKDSILDLDPFTEKEVMIYDYLGHHALINVPGKNTITCCCEVNTEQLIAFLCTWEAKQALQIPSVLHTPHQWRTVVADYALAHPAANIWIACSKTGDEIRGVIFFQVAPHDCTVVYTCGHNLTIRKLLDAVTRLYAGREIYVYQPSAHSQESSTPYAMLYSLDKVFTEEILGSAMSRFSSAQPWQVTLMLD